MLHYFAYMATQVDDVDFIIADFLQPAVMQTPSVFTNNVYFLQPRDTFTYANPGGYYIFRDTDCEGNAIVITNTHENSLAKNNVILFPNPSGNIINFKSTEIIQNIRIYSLLGALLTEINNADFQQQINVSNYSNGEYICMIQVNNEIITKKISVIR